MATNKIMAVKPMADDIKYRAKDALHTLKRAEEIKADKGLMKHVTMCAKEEMKALAKVSAGKRK